MKYTQPTTDALTALLNSDPFSASMLMGMEIIETEEIEPGQPLPTAATDCFRRIWVNPNFMAGMSPSEGAAILAHEISHKVLLHGSRTLRMLEERGEVYAGIMNIAQDFQINKYLDDMGYPFKSMAATQGALTLADVEEQIKALGGAGDGSKGNDSHKKGFMFDKSIPSTQSSEDIYERLIKLIPPSAKPNGGGSGQAGSSPGSGDPAAPNTGEGEGDSDSGVGSILKGDDVLTDKYKEALGKEGLSPDQADLDTKSSIVAAAQAAQDSGRGIGSMPASVQQIIDEFNTPSNDWRSILNRFATAIARDDWSYRRPNRRSIGDIISPSLYSERVGPIYVVVDTSGSVSDEELQQGLSEMASITKRVKPEELVVIPCDTGPQKPVRYKAGQAIANIDVKSRGGTDMMPAFEHIMENEKRPAAVICFTDAELPSWPTKEDMQGVPLIWAICNGREWDGVVDFGGEYGTAVRVTVED